MELVTTPWINNNYCTKKPQAIFHYIVKVVFSERYNFSCLYIAMFSFMLFDVTRNTYFWHPCFPNTSAHAQIMSYYAVRNIHICMDDTLRCSKYVGLTTVICWKPLLTFCYSKKYHWTASSAVVLQTGGMHNTLICATYYTEWSRALSFPSCSLTIPALGI
jgi:hypothetical protein